MTLIPDRRTTSIFKDVREFLAISQPQMMHKLGEPIKPNVASLAWKLIDEEVNKELKEDLQKLIDGKFSLEILTRVFDHYLDIIYVAAWALEAFGLPSQAGWNEVQRANMSKFPPADYGTTDVAAIKGLDPTIDVDVKIRNGRLILNNSQTGKVVKPVGWTPPDIFGVVQGMLTINMCKSQHDIVATPFMKEYFKVTEERIENE